MGAGRKRSEEHLLGEAILETLGLSKCPMNLHVFDGLNDKLRLARRPAIAGNAVARPVFCEPCNNGWMSALETGVVDTIQRLVERRTDMESLSNEARAALARWTLKTGLAIYHSPGIRPPLLDRRLYDAAHQGGWPTGAVAFVTRLPEDCGAYTALNCNFSLFTWRTAEEFEWTPSVGFAAAAVYRDLMLGLAYMDPTTTRGRVGRGHPPALSSLRARTRDGENVLPAPASGRNVVRRRGADGGLRDRERNRPQEDRPRFLSQSWSYIGGKLEVPLAL